MKAKEKPTTGVRGRSRPSERNKRARIALMAVNGCRAYNIRAIRVSRHRHPRMARPRIWSVRDVIVRANQHPCVLVCMCART